MDGPWGAPTSFSGSFHSPNFLSYNFSPYLNQSGRIPTSSRSPMPAASTSARISFAGSKFPGSITYSKAYNSEGNYAVPGLANYVTHGNSDTFGINWSENLPDAPSFSAGFQSGTSQYSVYGTNDNGKNSFHSLNLHSGYRWEGFNMGAYYLNWIGTLADSAGRNWPKCRITFRQHRLRRQSALTMLPLARLVFGRYKPIYLE